MAVEPWTRARCVNSGGALHAVEIRDGMAVSYLSRESDADAGVFWHAGSVLALPESGLPSQYSRLLEPEEFSGGLTVPIASHVHRVAADGSRVLFAVDDGVDRRGEGGAQARAMAREAGRGRWDGRVRRDLAPPRGMGGRRRPAQCPVGGARAGHVAARHRGDDLIMSSSSSRRRPAWPTPRGSPCPSVGCPARRAGSASCGGAATGPGCGGSASIPAW